MSHLLTIKGVALLLGLRVAKVQRLVDGRRIPCIELPTGDVRFVEADVLNWARSHQRRLVEHIEAGELQPTRIRGER